ncbi:MAG TPA: hypothetical protein VIK73_00690 [Limnochordales bacterium]
MRITRKTLVKEAVESSREAPAIFARHGINPLDRCQGMYDLNSIEDAEEWCGLHDIDGLIRELNEAAEREAKARDTLVER